MSQDEAKDEDKEVVDKEAAAKAKKEAELEAEKKEFLKKAYDTLNVTEEQVDQWRKSFRNVGLVFVGTRPYIFRSLRRPEFKTIRGLQVGKNVDFELVVQEKTTTICLLAPRLTTMDLQNENAGLAQTIADAIWEISDFQSDTPTIRL